MKLYGFAASPNTWKVRALAAHVGLPIELVPVDIAKGESRASSFLALNPTGRTPVLADADFVLWESEAIMTYIASVKKSTLYPDDPKRRADIMRWQSWTIRHWGAQACEPLLTEHLVKAIMGLGSPDRVVVALAEKAFHLEAKMLDTHLASRKFLTGDAVTVADFSASAPLFYAEGGKLPLGGYANIKRWFGAVSSLPCWGETAPRM